MQGVMECALVFMLTFYVSKPISPHVYTRKKTVFVKMLERKTADKLEKVLTTAGVLPPSRFHYSPLAEAGPWFVMHTCMGVWLFRESSLSKDVESINWHWTACHVFTVWESENDQQHMVRISIGLNRIGLVSLNGTCPLCVFQCHYTKNMCLFVCMCVSLVPLFLCGPAHDGLPLLWGHFGLSTWTLSFNFRVRAWL